MLSGGAASGLRGARFPLWGTGGGFGRAVLEYTELLAGKRADNDEFIRPLFRAANV